MLWLDRLARSITPLENAGTIEEAFDAANGAGVPGQNLVLADRSGRIGWTVFGAIPFRVGMDGRFPTTWGDGWRGWNQLGLPVVAVFQTAQGGGAFEGNINITQVTVSDPVDNLISMNFTFVGTGSLQSVPQ